MNSADTKAERVSIVNAAHPDPAGSGYLPPTVDAPYWRDPDGRRVTVKEVWAGADPETTRWIFDLTLNFIVDTYRASFYKAQHEGRIFRGAGVSSLLAELQSQLGLKHWVTTK